LIEREEGLGTILIDEEMTGVSSPFYDEWNETE
jgi:hypothetical protein